MLVPLLHALLGGAEPQPTLSEYGQHIHPPQITGNQLFEAYQDHGGPGIIDKRKMWVYHTHLADAPYEVDQLVRDTSNSEVINHLFATACYPEHGLPLLLYFAKAYNVDIKSALLANANAGGDNVHRGMVLGLLLGAAIWNYRNI